MKGMTKLKSQRIRANGRCCYLSGKCCFDGFDLKCLCMSKSLHPGEYFMRNGKTHFCIYFLLRPPEYILPLAGTLWPPVETAPVLGLATAACIYPQLVMPREGRSSSLGEQIQTGASQTCTPWIWVRPACAPWPGHGAVCHWPWPEHS